GPRSSALRDLPTRRGLCSLAAIRRLRLLDPTRFILAWPRSSALRDLPTRRGLCSLAAIRRLRLLDPTRFILAWPRSSPLRDLPTRRGLFHLSSSSPDLIGGPSGAHRAKPFSRWEKVARRAG